MRTYTYLIIYMQQICPRAVVHLFKHAFFEPSALVLSLFAQVSAAAPSTLRAEGYSLLGRATHSCCDKLKFSQAMSSNTFQRLPMWDTADQKCSFREQHIQKDTLNHLWSK